MPRELELGEVYKIQLHNNKFDQIRLNIAYIRYVCKNNAYSFKRTRASPKSS